MAKTYVIDYRLIGKRFEHQRFQLNDKVRIIKGRDGKFHTLGTHFGIVENTVKGVGYYIRAVRPEHAKLLDANAEQIETLQKQRRALIQQSFEEGRPLGASEVRKDLYKP